MTDKEKYIAYEKVRRSGITNMFDFNTVKILSGLSFEDIKFVIHNYTELNKKYNSKFK